MTVAERRIAVIAMGSRLTNFNLYSIYFLQPRPTHTPVDRRRSVVSSRRSSCSEQSSTSCHVCSVSDCIPKSPEDLSLQSLFLVTTLYHIFVVPAQRLFVISDTLIVLFTYLLTYLHVLWTISLLAFISQYTQNMWKMQDMENDGNSRKTKSFAFSSSAIWSVIFQVPHFPSPSRTNLKLSIHFQSPISKSR